MGSIAFVEVETKEILRLRRGVLAVLETLRGSVSGVKRAIAHGTKM
jgi:hypothetical protein